MSSKLSPSLELNRFNIKSINFKPRFKITDDDNSKGPIITLIGRRDTGKSFLVRDILYHHQDIPVGTVISGTEEGNGFYTQIVPKLFIHHEYQSSIVENLLIRQKKMKKTVNKELAEMKKTSIDPRLFFIMDDCLYDSAWTRDKLIRLLFLNGRHWAIMLIITMQYPLGIPPMLRTNIDYVFILREPYTRNRKILYENYCGVFPTFEIFTQVLDAITEDFGCLVIHNNAKSNKIKDQVFWYKADKRPPFRLGNKEFWDLSKDIDSEEEKEEEFNSRKELKRPITVKKSGKF